MIHILQLPTYIPLPPHHTNPPRSTRHDLTAQPLRPSARIRLAQGREITAWQQTVWLDVASVSDSVSVFIDGANVTDMAAYIIAVFYHLRLKKLDPSSPSTFPTPYGIRYPRTAMTHLSFLQHQVHRTYRMCVPSIYYHTMDLTFLR